MPSNNTHHVESDCTLVDIIPWSASRKSRSILYLVFLLSGMTALVYETTWARYLQLFLGHAAYAQVLVLSLFMGGMAAGALVVSRLRCIRTAPLLAYAVIEALLGIAALVFHPLFDGIIHYVYDSLLPNTSGAGQVLQWLLATTIILPQSVLLGMTFPLMSAAVLRLGSQPGGRIFAMLYFTNSAGAVVGVLLAGFWLIEYFGLQTAMTIAGMANLVVAAIAFTVACRTSETVPEVTRPMRGKSIGRWLLAFAFLTAAASFVYEIAWLRMLTLVQGASTHAFETMLSAFILGIALGGLWIRRRIENYQNPLAVLARVQILMGLAAIATLPAYHFAFDFMAFMMRWLPRDTLGYVGYNITSYVISAGIMVPASFFAGMTLPLLTYILYSQGRGESEIGAVYGWNTLGSIAGIALAGLLLMPLIGLKNMLLLGATVDIGLGIALVAYLFQKGQLSSLRLTLALVMVSLFVLFAILWLYQLDLNRTASGVFGGGKARIPPSATVIHHADGRTATVNLLEYENGGLSITTNGKVDALINMARARGDLDALPGVDEYTMVMLSAIPLAHRPDARTAAVIGHGSGLSTHTALASPHLEQLDVVEIEPEMIRAARAFQPRVARAYTDSRSRYFVQDARTFFSRAPEYYDIVISEPSNPWVSGVASLFTPEFYRQVKRAMAPGGIFVQWFHLYDIDRSAVQSIVHGLSTEFSDYVYYAGNDLDMMIIAVADGEVPPLSDELFEWPAMQAELGYLDIHSLEQLKLFRVAHRSAYAPLLEKGPINLDYFPVLEFAAARNRFMGGRDHMLTEMARDAMPILEILSSFEAPHLPEQTSSILPHVYTRFADVNRAIQLAEALEASRLPEYQMLSQTDQKNLARLLEFRLNESRSDWQQWFRSLFTIAQPIIPNGGTPALAQFIGSSPVDDALRSAPTEIREKVAFLLLVAHRDFDAIRIEGARLMDGPLQTQDPSFYAYVQIATSTACLMAIPNEHCREVLDQLDQVQRESVVYDLLRAHRQAWR